MATTNEAKQMTRGASFVKSLGENLDVLQGRDVALYNYSTEDRKIRGNDTTLVRLGISEVGSDEVKDYHAFSTPLAERIEQIPQSELPVLVKFVKAKTSGGFNVWSIE